MQRQQTVGCRRTAPQRAGRHAMLFRRRPATAPRRVRASDPAPAAAAPAASAYARRRRDPRARPGAAYGSPSPRPSRARASVLLARARPACPPTQPRVRRCVARAGTAATRRRAAHATFLAWPCGTFARVRGCRRMYDAIAITCEREESSGVHGAHGWSVANIGVACWCLID